MFNIIPFWWYFLQIVIFQKKWKKNGQIFKHSGFHLHTRSTRRIYNREYIKPFGFRSIFTILQLFFYVSKKKLIFRHWKKPFSIFFLFFFPSFFSTSNIVRSEFTLPSWNSLRDSCKNKKKKRIISPSKHVTLAHFQRRMFVFRSSLLKAIVVCRNVSRTERQASFSRFQRAPRPRILLFPVGRLASANFHKENGATPPENSTTGGGRRSIHLIIFTRISRSSVSLSRTLVFLDTVSIDCHFRRTFATSSSNEQLLFPFLSFSTKNNNRFDRYRMTVFIVFKGNFISSLIPVNAPRFFSPLTSIITIGLKLP